LERLQKEKPDTPMEELVKEADAIVAAEIEERKKEREEADKKWKEEQENKEKEEGEITEA